MPPKTRHFWSVLFDKMKVILHRIYLVTLLKKVCSKPNNSICLTYYKSPRSEKKIFSFRPFVSFTFDGQKRRLGSWASWTGTWTSTAKRKVVLEKGFRKISYLWMQKEDTGTTFMLIFVMMMKGSNKFAKMRLGI